jgi:hypothetical protein
VAAASAGLAASPAGGVAGVSVGGAEGVKSGVADGAGDGLDAGVPQPLNSKAKANKHNRLNFFISISLSVKVISAPLKVRNRKEFRCSFG